MKLGIYTKDRTGKVFGNLTAISLAKYEKNIAFWKCICICGKTVVKRITNLTQGKSISCGCRNKYNRSVGASLPKTEASFNEIYRSYKYSSKYKGRKFNLSKNQFKKLTSDICYYCNSEPKTKSHTHDIRHNGTYIYNGVDRINNNLGYTIKNCVTCCGICNEMKMDRTEKEFLDHITKIYESGINGCKKKI